MKFDKDVFKKHYGKRYIDLIRYTLIADVVALIIVIGGIIIR